jgi:hypothetical protein
MEVTYRLRFWDLLWFKYYQAPRTLSFQIIVGFLLIIFGLVVFWTFSYTTYSLLGKVVMFILFLAAMTLAWMIFEFLYLAFLQLISYHQRMQVGGHSYKLSISEYGLVGETYVGRSEIKWLGIVKISQSKNYILIYFSERTAIVVPKRSFANKIAADSFFTYTRKFWEDGKKVSAPN